MSNNEKTKQKLMESMRMTKEGSDEKVKYAEIKQNIAPQDEKPVKKKNKNTETDKAAKGTKQLDVNPYQKVSRVWPD